MRHAGEKLRLGARRRQRLLASLDQLAFGLLQSRNIAAYRDHALLAQQLGHRRRHEAGNDRAVSCAKTPLNTLDLSGGHNFVLEAFAVGWAGPDAEPGFRISDCLGPRVAGELERRIHVDIAAVHRTDCDDVGADLEDFAQLLLALPDFALRSFAFPNISFAHRGYRLSDRGRAKYSHPLCRFPTTGPARPRSHRRPCQ